MGDFALPCDCKTRISADATSTAESWEEWRRTARFGSPGVRRFQEFDRHQFRPLLVAAFRSLDRKSHLAVQLQDNVRFTETKSDVSLQLIRTQAKQLLAASKWQEAIVELEKAKASALANGQDQAAFQLGLEIGALYNRFERRSTPFSPSLRLPSPCRRILRLPRYICLGVGHWPRPSKPWKSVVAGACICQRSRKQLSNFIAATLERWPNQKSALSARRWLDECLLRDENLPGVAKLWVDALPVILDDPASLSSLVSRIAFSTFPSRSYQSSKRIRTTPSRSTNRQLSLNPS